MNAANNINIQMQVLACVHNTVHLQDMFYLSKKSYQLHQNNIMMNFRAQIIPQPTIIQLHLLHHPMIQLFPLQHPYLITITNITIRQYYKRKPTMQRQDEQQAPLPVSTATSAAQCSFYVSRKRRFCKFPAINQSKFCAAHCSDQANKIECPYEKGMFIDASKLQRHLQICPKIKNKKQEQASQWFTKGVNLEQNTITMQQADGNLPQQELHKMANIDAIEDIGVDKLVGVVRKVVKFFQQSFEEHAMNFLITTPQQKIEGLTNDHTQAHLLASSAMKVGLIRADIIYIQFGAGKGILSYHIAQLVKKECQQLSKNVLLEREVRRNKFDRFMKDNVYFQRFKTDVSDFDVSKMPTTMAQTAKLRNPQLDVQKQAAQLNQLQIVGVCKHMCGAALDISVRALMKTKMSGCILASCCHHLCTLETYLNPPFFLEHFSPQQLQIIFKISAWGTKSTTLHQQQISLQHLASIQAEQLSGKNKIVVGRMCKRLIDLGRANILGCQVKRYCSDLITPENFVIVTR